MGASKLRNEELAKIKVLRKQGFSISEISAAINRCKATIAKRVVAIEVGPEFEKSWRSKRGGNTSRALARKEVARNNSTEIVGSLTKRDLLLIASCLYWGEGSKKDFSFINSDPKMINVMIVSLKKLGIDLNRIKLGIRIYEDIDSRKAKKFWQETTGLEVRSVDVIRGNKSGKLPFGMCRLRLTKGNDYFNLFSATVELISRIKPS